MTRCRTRVRYALQSRNATERINPVRPRNVSRQYIRRRKIRCVTSWQPRPRQQINRQAPPELQVDGPSLVTSLKARAISNSYVDGRKVVSGCLGENDFLQKSHAASWRSLSQRRRAMLSGLSLFAVDFATHRQADGMKSPSVPMTLSFLFTDAAVRQVLLRLVVFHFHFCSPFYAFDAFRSSR